MVSVTEAARLIREGKVVAYPTETAYGLGADALDEEAVSQVYELKQRPMGKKCPIIVSSIDQLTGHAFINDLGKYLSRHLHPGPLSITVKSELPWFGAFRLSSSPTASRLAEEAGVPLTATSANRSGEPTPFTPQDVLKYFDVPVVGDEELQEGPVSTVYDPFELRVIREGAISRTEIKRHLVAFQALQEARPTAEEREEVEAIAQEALRKVQEKHENTVLGGSVAKGTFTRGVNDIDLFLLFPPDADLKGKLELLKEVARSLGGRPEVNYAQHPYVKTRFQGVDVELVPAHETEPPEVLSAADRSPWHVEFVRGLPEEVRDEVLIFKQFCQGAGVYGADARVEGLSAYAMEVLVAEEKNFVEVLEKLADWNYPPKLADPVDPERNVLASVSGRSWEQLREAAKEYLSGPERRFFFPRGPPVLEKLPGLENKVLVAMERPDMVEDAAWGHLRGVARKLERNAELDDWKVKRWSVFLGKRALMAFEAFPGRGKKLIRGPEVGMEEHAERFREAHDEWFEQEGRLYAREEKRFPTFGELVDHFTQGAETLTGEDIRELYGELGERGKRWFSGFLLDNHPWEY